MRSSILVLALLATLPAAAQTIQSADPIQAACGQPKENFKVTTQPSPTPDTLIPGKAQVYLIEVQDRVAFCPLGCGITVKVGLDGTWAGATSGDSFLALSVDPGEHHLCTAWQSKLGSQRKNLQLAGFTADPGKRYYFRVHITPSTPDTIAQFALEPINPDEGKLLTTTNPKSLWTKK